MGEWRFRWRVGPLKFVGRPFHMMMAIRGDQFMSKFVTAVAAVLVFAFVGCASKKSEVSTESKTDNALVKVQPKDNTPPPGFVAAFDGKDLTGWKGLLKPKLDNPFNRAKLTPDELAAAQKEA